MLAQKSWTEWRWAAERDRLNTTGSWSKCGSVDHIQEPDHVLSLGKPLTCFQQTFFRKLILPALGRAGGLGSRKHLCSACGPGRYIREPFRAMELENR